MTGYNITPVQADVFAVIQPWIMAVTGLPNELVLQGMPNRTAMPPAAPGFVEMTITTFKNLRTPVITWDQSPGGNPTELSVESGTRLLVQLDFYGPTSGDWAKAVSGNWRTDPTCMAFEPTCDPLHADEATMGPLDDSEEQYEFRWTVLAYVQYNPVTTVPMQFADQAEVTLISVDKAYPP